MNINDSYQGMDAGPNTLKRFESILKSKTILWNGLVGVFELNFSKGTKNLENIFLIVQKKEPFH